MTDNHEAALVALIAWAYRDLERRDAKVHDGEKYYSSAFMEFSQAATQLIPGIEDIAKRVNYHADLAVAAAESAGD